MNTMKSESLGHLACLAAVELENFRELSKETLSDVEALVTFLANDAGIWSSTCRESSINSIFPDPVVAYALRDGINSISTHGTPESAEDFVQILKTKLIDPLNLILEKYRQNRDLDGLEEHVNIVVKLCLKISSTYSSINESVTSTEVYPSGEIL